MNFQKDPTGTFMAKPKHAVNGRNPAHHLTCTKPLQIMGETTISTDAWLLPSTVAPEKWGFEVGRLRVIQVLYLFLVCYFGGPLPCFCKTHLGSFGMLHVRLHDYPPPPKFNIAPEKWWLETYFPVGKVTFQGYVTLREGTVVVFWGFHRGKYTLVP